MERAPHPPVRDGHLFRVAGLVTAACLLAGCESPPKTPPPAPPPPPQEEVAPLPPPPPAPVARPASPAAQQQAQKAAIAAAEQYELGNEEATRAELKRALGLDAQNKLALNLTRQLTADPQTVLGVESFAYTVRPGETLSRIAGRFLNDIYAFVILARYNNIAVPKQVAAGQTIQVPGKPRAGTTLPAPPPPAPPPNPRSNGSTRSEPAPADASRAETARGGTPVGGAAPSPTLPAAASPLPTPPAAPVRPPPPPPEPTPGEKAMQAAQAAERSGDLVTARNQYLAAAARGQPGATGRAEATTHTLVQRYGTAARGALARQDLDGSIANWQRVLDLDPGNSTARVEIERMRALQKKLGGLK